MSKIIKLLVKFRKDFGLKCACNVRFIVNGPFLKIFFWYMLFSFIISCPFAFLSCVMFNVRNLMVAKSCMHDGILFNS